ncbi:angiotensin-converting enzyme-like protein [Dinothrombium tinctorium]|uniref:Angiotensin-converting enzyme n=1 Tax=Dinothrombium tinctorium TaxID=1965070 RepID=A0A3S3NXH5_9ACAR|nr:angiotensin-converting enzyme-like protein [Dinothrombium tinctorium]
METIYATAKVCVKNKCNMSLEPDLVNVLKKERDYDILKEAWTSWRQQCGRKMKYLYQDYVRMANEIAMKNSVTGFKFNDYGEYWLFNYESSDIKEQVNNIWQEIEEFYKDLHAFVRMKLRVIYGDKMPKDGTIPAHLLGDMWAQTWANILDEITPFKHLPSLNTDVAQNMRLMHINQTQMFKLAESFFVGIGLDYLPESFWKRSMFKKPDDRQVMCHAAAWDFKKNSDFRIRQCAQIEMEDLIIAHHEMGHIQYYILYKDQPFVLREGANPGFHEAIGDLIALSVSTPGHLEALGFLKNYEDSYAALINFQLNMALQKIAFLPFSYLVDLWRWAVFAGNISSDHYNRKWWELRIRYQGVSPPVKRTEDDFDPGSKYHFHKALCSLANQTVLYKCDLVGNEIVGQKLKEVLSQGWSEPWQKQLKQLTNSDLSAQPMLEYFEPLRQYLKDQIQGENVGWQNNGTRFLFD